jgi:hypothetical protein
MLPRRYKKEEEEEEEAMMQGNKKVKGLPGENVECKTIRINILSTFLGDCSVRTRPNKQI